MKVDIEGGAHWRDIAGQSFSMEQLCQWCQEYDDALGNYPEHPLAGWSFWLYVQARLNGLDVEDAIDVVNLEELPDHWGTKH